MWHKIRSGHLIFTCRRNIDVKPSAGQEDLDNKNCITIERIHKSVPLLLCFFSVIYLSLPLFIGLIKLGLRDMCHLIHFLLSPWPTHHSSESSANPRPNWWSQQNKMRDKNWTIYHEDINWTIHSILLLLDQMLRKFILPESTNSTINSGDVDEANQSLPSAGEFVWLTKEGHFLCPLLAHFPLHPLFPLEEIYIINKIIIVLQGHIYTLVRNRCQGRIEEGERDGFKFQLNNWLAEGNKEEA